MQVFELPLEIWLVWLVGAVVYLAIMAKIARNPKQEYRGDLRVDIKEVKVSSAKTLSAKPKIEKYGANKKKLEKPVDRKLSDKEKKQILAKLSKTPLVEEGKGKG